MKRRMMVILPVSLLLRLECCFPPISKARHHQQRHQRKIGRANLIDTNTEAVHGLRDPDDVANTAPAWRAGGGRGGGRGSSTRSLSYVFALPKARQRSVGYLLSVPGLHRQRKTTGLLSWLSWCHWPSSLFPACGISA